MLGQIKNIIVIAGCQRSGTTLLGNILGCHRQAFLIDEDNGLYDWVEKCLFAEDEDHELTQTVFAQSDHKYVGGHKRIEVFNGTRKFNPEIDTLVLKAPNLTYSYEALSELPYNVQIVYPVRDPRAVVASMSRLEHIDMVGNQVKWIQKNPELALELKEDIEVLGNSTVPIHQRRAVVWRIKSGLYTKFRAAGLNTFVFKYEDLVRDKHRVCKDMMEAIGLPFDNKMTRHEKFFRGLAPGLTLRGRAIDSSSTMKWKNRLGPKHAREVLEAAQPLAAAHEYYEGVNGHFVRQTPKFSNEVFERPIILTGRGGSGTRMISEIAQKLGVFVGNQLNFAGDSIEWVDLIYEFAIKKTISTTRGQKFTEDMSGSVLDKVQDILEAGNYDMNGQWGWKLPETMMIVPEMMNLFNKAKLVHLVRHPVTSSLRRTHMTSRYNNPIGRAVLQGAYKEIGRNPKNIKTDPEYFHNAVTWLYQVRRVHEYAMYNLSAENYHLVKFEDLMDRPLEFSKKLSHFITGRASEFVSPAVDGHRATKSLDLSGPEAQEVWKICGSVALDIGYEPIDKMAKINQAAE